MKIAILLLALIAVVLSQSVKLEPVNEKCKLSHSVAAGRISSAGIGISSSGGCSDRGNRRCTSLEQVRCRTIDGIVALKAASRCTIIITGKLKKKLNILSGGTETGHAGGPRSHWEGYKLDFGLNSCINAYIQNSFQYIGLF
jgi:hypothetical protein